MDKSVSSHVLETGEPVLVSNVEEDERFKKAEYANQYKTGSFVISPIRVGDEIIGTINANDKNDKGDFTEDDLVMLNTFSHQVSLTLRHAFLMNSLQRDKDRLELLSEMRNILPQINKADYIINSGLPYELPVFRARLLDSFKRWAEDYHNNPLRKDAFTRADRVYHLLQQVSPVEDESAIPSDSLLREFIGGSSLEY